MANPPLPPGFELETQDTPALPPGFQLEGINTYDDPGVQAVFDPNEIQSSVSTTEDLNQPRTMGEEALRSLGLGTRAVIGGIGDVVGIVSDPFIHAVNLAGEKGPTTKSLITGQPERRFERQMTQREAAEALSDRLGLPRPETPVERVSGGITSAVSGTGGLIGLGRGLVAQAPGVVQAIGAGLSEAPGLQLAGAATGSGASNVVREAGGSEGAQLAAGLVGGVTPAAATVGLPAVASGALKSSVPEARKAVAREAQELGIELTPAQLSDSRFLKWAQSMLRSVPFTGAQGRYANQVGQFNRALSRTIGEEADVIDPQVYATAKQRQSAQFDDLTSRNALRVDDRLIRSLSNIADNAKINKGVSDQVESAIDSLYAQATTGPGGVVIPGAAYQSFDSTLGNITKAGGEAAHFLGNVRDAVRRAMDDSIRPEDAMAWRQLRREYGNRKTLAPLVAKAGGEEISPAQVLGAATASKSAKEAAASGRRGDLGTLGNIGRLIREPPSSGTAERIGVSSLLGGAAVMDPVTGTLTAIGANLLSRGLDSKGLARLMIRENPGLTMAEAEKIIRRSATPAAVTTQQNIGGR